MESCLNVVGAAYIALESNPPRLDSLIQWTEEVSKIPDRKFRCLVWILRLAFKFSVLFMDLPIGLDLSCCPGFNQDRLKLFHILMGRGGFPVRKTRLFYYFLLSK